MIQIKADELHPGMILGADIILPNGRLLFRKDTLLDFEHLRAVRLAGVKNLEILENNKSKSDSSAAASAGAPERSADNRYLIEKRLSKCPPDHPIIQEIFRVVLANPGLAGFSPVPPFPVPSNEIWHRPQDDRSRGVQKSPSGSDDPLALLTPDLELVSLPDIFYQVVEVINNPRSSAFQVAEVISKDPNLSAKLLKIVNSAFYGFPKPVDTISRAVAIVGSDQLSTLTLGTSVFALFRDIPAELMTMRWFWEHSLASGIAARAIASYKNLPHIEQLFISGLLHDLGKLIIYKNLPQKAKAVLTQARREDSFQVETEQDLLGFTHAQLGTALTRKWRLPLNLEQAIGGHHQPLQYPPSPDAAVVFLADSLINALGYGTSGEQFVSPQIIEVWEFLKLPGGFSESLVPLINQQVEDTFQIFFNQS
ncbi:MAG: HDOD domain-containing protein [Desulfobacterota bacterium]|nr:HDOD domain-containing protein [Thermodesulfobacteriota bacterium]